MLESLNAAITTLAGSQWAYLAIFLAVAIDAFFPAMPGEVFVIAGSVAAASGEQSLLAVIAASVAGAFVGDHVSYALGRFLNLPARRLARTRRAGQAYQRAQAALHTRGGTVIVAMRFVAGGRTATTLVAGTLRYPLARFSAFDAVAAVLSSSYVALLGYWAGDIFEGQPATAILVGLAISACLAAAAEATRRARRRTRTADSADATETQPTSPEDPDPTPFSRKH